MQSTAYDWLHWYKLCWLILMEYGFCCCEKRLVERNYWAIKLKKDLSLNEHGQAKFCSTCIWTQPHCGAQPRSECVEEHSSIGDSAMQVRLFWSGRKMTFGSVLADANWHPLRPDLWTTHPLSSGLPLFLIPELRAVSGNLRQPEVKCFAYK